MTLADFDRHGVTRMWLDGMMRGSDNECLFELVTACGLPAHGDIEAQWLGHDMLQAEGMVDTLVAVHGGEQARLDACCPLPFTCWNQSKNHRYSNEGNRIDYILVDAMLAPTLLHHPGARLCEDAAKDDAPRLSLYNGRGFKRSVVRATANGRYAPAPTDGGGMEPLCPSVCGVPFLDLPRTGLLVTPPQLSDHIGVCALFAFDLRRCDGTCQSAGCQHKPANMSLKAMFEAVKKKPPLPEAPAAPVTTAAAAAACVADDADGPPAEKKPRTEIILLDD